MSSKPNSIRPASKRPPASPAEKYTAFRPIDLPDRQWPSRVIAAPPIWCSVDLRDGNQALVEPMNGARKRRMFELLVEMRSEEHTSELQSLMRISYAVFCLTQKTTTWAQRHDNTNDYHQEPKETLKRHRTK